MEIAVCYQAQEKELALALPRAMFWAMACEKRKWIKKNRAQTEAPKHQKPDRGKEVWGNFVDENSKASVCLALLF